MRLVARLLGPLPRSWVRALARLQWRHPLMRVFDAVAARMRCGDQVVLGAGRGLRLNAGPPKDGYVLRTSEPHVQEALRLLVIPGSRVFKIGANIRFLPSSPHSRRGGAVV